MYSSEHSHLFILVLKQKSLGGKPGFLLGGYGTVLTAFSKACVIEVMVILASWPYGDRKRYKLWNFYGLEEMSKKNGKRRLNQNLMAQKKEKLGTSSICNIKLIS